MPYLLAPMFRSSFRASLVLLVLSGCGSGDGGGSITAVQIDSTITSTQCVLTVAVAGAVAVDSGDLTIDYSASEGDFGPPKLEARCRSLPAEVTRATAFNRCEDSCADGEARKLYLAFAVGEILDDKLLQAPVDLFECLFEGDGASLAGSDVWASLLGFGLAETDATAEVRVECDGWPATTTSTTTTSTLPCQGDGCETGDRLPIQIWLDDAVALGSLQYDIQFSSLVGSFAQHSSGALECTLAPGLNALYATNQVPRLDDPTCDGCLRSIRLGFVFATGLTGPARLLDCDFLVAERVPQASDFSVTIVDAASPAGLSVEPLPAASVRGFPEE